MKRLLCFVCLFLCLCILFPVFLISVYARDVNGYDVLTFWYFDDIENTVNFEDTIISRSSPTEFVVYTSIVLTEPIPKNNLWDFELVIEHNDCIFDSIELRFLNSNSKLITTQNATIVDNVVSASSLLLDDTCTKVIVTFFISQPNWKVVSTVYDVSIDGVLYQYEKDMTWSSWCLSDYNTLGLYVDNGYLYTGDSLSGKILKCNGNSVLSSDLVDKSLTYTLESLGSAVTYINFKIDSTTYQAESGMTWAEWVNSEYNTSGYYISDSSVCGSVEYQKVYYSNELVSPDSEIVADRVYRAVVVIPVYTVLIDGVEYDFESGMTWADWIESDYNPGTYWIKANQNYIFNTSGQQIKFVFSDDVSGSHFSVMKSSVIKTPDEHIYGTDSYLDSLSSSTYALSQYEFDFIVDSVLTVVRDDLGLFNAMVAWLMKIWDGVTGLSSEIASSVSSALENLFVPNDGRILAIKEEFEQELRGRFGVLFDAVDIVDMVAGTFVYKGTTETIKLPSVTVDLAGTPFTFGGYEVDVIPDGFEGLVDALRLVVNITCTWWFVLAMKKRLEEVLSK